MVPKATACTRGHGGRGRGVNIQLSSFNFETVTRGDLSQLAGYCLTLKISASTRMDEATLFVTETTLPLMQMAGRFSPSGVSFFRVMNNRTSKSTSERDSQI